MPSERLRAFAREYASRPPVAHVAHDPQPMGNMGDGGKAQSIQSVGGGVASVAYVAHEFDNVGGNEGDAPAGRDPAARLLLMLWALGVTVAAARDGALTITPNPHRHIPDVLMAAVRRHRTALAAWVGAAPALPLVEQAQTAARSGQQTEAGGYAILVGNAGLSSCSGNIRAGGGGAV